jgi:predicted transcriptional regulator
MKLKAINVYFKKTDDIFAEINLAIKSQKSVVQKKNSINFDSPQTWRSLMSNQKQEILVAIARYRPSSVYQLAKILGRPSQHTLKDCRHLELVGFIKLVDSKDARASLRPELAFDYDVIRLHTPMNFSILLSAKSEQVIERACGAV